MTQDSPIHVLLVDGDPEDCALVRTFLERGMHDMHDCSQVDTLAAAVGHIARCLVDVILLNLNLPDSQGIETLESLRGAAPNLPIIVLSATSEREAALHVVQAGAQDSFPKDRLNSDALSRVVRFSVERQRRINAERELRAAEQVQARLFPSTAPQVTGLSIAGAAFSAGDACGDYYDYLSFPTGELGVVVGDVSGHGMAAAMRMIETRAYLRSRAAHESDLAELLTRLNQFMVRESAYGSGGMGQFVTLFLAAIDSETMTMRYASAGHLGYLVRRNGSVERMLGTGLPLGVADLPYENSDIIPLAEGDTVLLTTDGLEETMSASGNLFGSDRLLSVIRRCRHERPATVIRELYRAATEHSGAVKQQDDITAVIVRIGERQAVTARATATRKRTLAVPHAFEAAPPLCGAGAPAVEFH